MTNHFDSNGGEQNIAQGENAIGKRENVTQEVRRDGNIFSGTGNVTVNKYGVRMKTRTVLLGAGLAAVLLGAGLAGWHWLTPVPPPAKSAATAAPNSPAIITEKGNVAVTYNNPSGVPPELFAQYVKELGATEQVVNGFFGTLLKEKVPRDQWDSKLREIAANYKELLQRMEAVQSEDPQVVKLKKEAKQAIEAGDYVKAEELLKEADARDVQAIEQIKKEREKLDKAERQRRLSSADTNVSQAIAQRVQLHYAKAAEYWQKAAAILPEDNKKDRSLYLHKAAFDLDRVSRYKAARPLYEQSLRIRREIGDKEGEGVTLNNISQIYDARGDYTTAMKYLEQSLRIMQEIGDKEGEGVTLNNISQIYRARYDFNTALKYLEQSLIISRQVGNKKGEGVALSNIGKIYEIQGNYTEALSLYDQGLVIMREIGDKAGEGTILHNIGGIHWAYRNYPNAMKYIKQSLTISVKIGDRKEEAECNWTIGFIYADQGDIVNAEKYMSRGMQINEDIGHSELQINRLGLSAIRTKLRTKLFFNRISSFFTQR